MTRVPQTTPAPKPVRIFMPGTTPATASALPPAPGQAKSAAAGDEEEEDAAFPQPKLRLEIRDLSHPGAARFLTSVNASRVLAAAVADVQRLLYRRPSDPATHVPPTRSVTVVLRDMGGVAYTTGSELDDDHKEIHVSLPYVHAIGCGRAADEITGVLTHELVHCYQWNGRGTCPGGLIEGVADWVRLGCGLSPPHWRRETAGRWDAGYQHTAYFLEYLEGRFGEGTVRRLNDKLRTQRYQEKPFWTELLGRPVEQLWQDYVDKVKEEDGQAVTQCDIKPGKTVDDGTQT